MNLIASGGIAFVFSFQVGGLFAWLVMFVFLASSTGVTWSCPSMPTSSFGAEKLCFVI